MLISLSIQNVVLIESLNIDFRDGLCALTGETGAGKSILLEALGLALGGRSDSGLVRKGADAAQVTAEFQIVKSHPAHAALREAAMESADTLILRRSVGLDGRSRAFINDQTVSIGLLKQIGESLVEIHGQFDTQGLLDPSTHGKLLDEYAGIDHSLRTLWDALKSAQAKLDEMRNAAGKAKAEEDYLRQAVEDLDALAPEPGEEGSLSALREQLVHREKVLEALNTAHHVLSGEEDPVRKAWAAIDRVSGKMAGGGTEIIAALGRASAEIEEASSLIQLLSTDLQESEHDLESIDERLHELKTQARKHHCTVDELAAMREKLAARLNLIENADEQLAAQGRKVEQARKSYIARAEKDSAQRHISGAKLDKLVEKELGPLKLGKAKFVTDIQRLAEKDWGAGGIDRIRFLVATNPGAEAGPLNKIASGGEMARFMLALKVVMAEVGTAGTLIFDEVDTGIGGAVADAVGERLTRLSKKFQVLVVTHAPQVAARAEHHYIVKKDGAKNLKTNVVELPDTAARREEIARMLSGAKVTQEARAAADKLLETNAA